MRLNSTCILPAALSSAFGVFALDPHRFSVFWLCWSGHWFSMQTLWNFHFAYRPIRRWTYR